MAAKSINESRNASKKVTAVDNLETLEKVRQLMLSTSPQRPCRKKQETE